MKTKTAATPALDLAKRTQAILFAADPRRLLDVGDMWDRDLEYRAEGPAQCSACGCPHKNTHAPSCPAR